MSLSRKRQHQSSSDGNSSNDSSSSEQKPELEFHYADSYLKEFDNDDNDETANDEVEKEKCQNYARVSNNFMFTSSSYSTYANLNQVWKIIKITIDQS